jgi:Fe-S-cluster-containing dehydrogenase component/formate-dependent nitrite reductase membrane component NrfD
MRYGFIIDNRKCIGCHACTVACKSEHDVPIGVNRTWVKYVEKGEFPNTRRVFSVHRCNHCGDAPCVEVCPVTSLFIRADGIVDFDSARCIGCKSCMQACPYDALYIDPETGTSAKCNYCAHRIDGSLEPACVVVCPTHAIVSGDLEAPGSEISRLLARQSVSVRKPEKGTRPNLFYIEGDQAALVPWEAPPSASYFNSAQAAGVGHHAASVSAKAMPAAGGAHGSARTYDAPDKGVLWNWEVSGYLWTKSIAAGSLLVPILLGLFGGESAQGTLQVTMGWVALLFLALTGSLLVKDLDRPARFLYVLLRPHWTSWLTRGAWLLMVYAALAGAWLAFASLTSRTPPVLDAMVAVLATLVAVYTAFLFAQCKGRDLWQSPLLPVHMLIQSVVAGASVLWLSAWVLRSDPPAGVGPLLGGGLTLLLVLTMVERLLPHVTGDTARALQLMTRGELRAPFWFAVLGGTALPLALLSFAPAGIAAPAACVLALAGLLTAEHTWVRAPQRVPLR